MIYDIHSNVLSGCYDVNGTISYSAYDVLGNQIFPFSHDLRIMTYNLLRWEGDNSMVSIQDIAFGNGADIVGIQEWGTTKSKTIDGISCETYLNNAGYDNVYITSLDVNHKAVASKYSMSNMTEVVFNQSIETRSYTKAYFQYDGKTIAFFNAHTDYQKNSSVKFAQIQELVSAVANEEYFILTGDLNTDCSAKTDNEYLNGTQKFIDAGYNVANSPVGKPLILTCYNGTTVQDSTNITPADNIVTSANISMVNVYTIDTKLTADTGYVIDHIPLVADIVIN